MGARFRFGSGSGKGDSAAVGGKAVVRVDDRTQDVVDPPRDAVETDPRQWDGERNQVGVVHHVVGAAGLPDAVHLSVGVGGERFENPLLGVGGVVHLVVLVMDGEHAHRCVEGGKQPEPGGPVPPAVVLLDDGDDRIPAVLRGGRVGEPEEVAEPAWRFRVSDRHEGDVALACGGGPVSVQPSGDDLPALAETEDGDARALIFEQGPIQVGDPGGNGARAQVGRVLDDGALPLPAGASRKHRGDRIAAAQQQRLDSVDVGCEPHLARGGLYRVGVRPHTRYQGGGGNEGGGRTDGS